jgi:hypothetical protein
MKIRSAASASAPTCTSLGDRKLAWPSYTVQFSMFFSQDSTPVLDFPEISSFRALTRFISTAIEPFTATPKSAARRTMWAAYALATMVLVGMQPVLTQVPPNSLRSMIATFMPAPASRFARDGPAWPVPMMMASNVLVITPSFSRTENILQRGAGRPCLVALYL